MVLPNITSKYGCNKVLSLPLNLDMAIDQLSLCKRRDDFTVDKMKIVSSSVEATRSDT